MSLTLPHSSRSDRDERQAGGVRRERASSAQVRLWSEQFMSNRAVYHVPAAFAFHGALDAGALGRAFAALVARHEALRTTFEEQGGDVVQVIGPAPVDAEPAAFVAVEAAPPGGLQALRARVRALASEPFDLRNGPLWRARLFVVGPREAVFVITMHHIVTDGWSFELLGSELAAYYAAYSGLTPQPELAPTCQYADFAAWEHAEMTGAAAERLRRYWRDELAGIPPAVTLPADRPLAARRTSAGDHVWIDVPAPQADRLRTFARAEGATLYAVLLACFGALLHRYSRDETVIIGTPVANRSRAEFESVVGLFANAVPLRLDFHERVTFRELVARARATTARALAHQALSFDRILEAAGVERDPQRTPLFQVMFTLQRQAVLRLPGVVSEVFDVGHPISAYELSLVVFDGPSLRAVWEFSSELFDRATVERLAAHYLRVADALIAAPDTAVGVVPWVTTDEARLVGRRWQSDWVAERHEPVHRWFEAQVRATPDALAVVHEGSRVTYAELNARANRLARCLRSRGVSAETCVAVCLERGADAVAAMLGVLKAGGVYVPLDVHDPPDRLRQIASACNATHAITASDGADEDWLHVGRVIRIDREAAALSGYAPDDLAVAIDPDQIAYVCFTSGTTGTPKGVTISHRSIAARLEWEQQALPIAPGDAVLNAASLSFDASIWEFLRALTGGARVVIPARSPMLDAGAVVATMAAEGITIACFVPSVLGALIDEAEWQSCTALRAVICSGEPLAPSLRSRFFDASEAALFNFYGPTEVTIDAAFTACSPSPEGAAAAIAQPVGGAWLRILDRMMEPVPIGVPGDIYVGGVGLARGYVGRPGETAQQFVPDPLASEPGARLYRTGDVGRFRADGALELLGRRDDQVKWNGVRVELAELEAILRTHPAVADVAVVLRAGEPLDEEPAGDRAAADVLAALESVPAAFPPAASRG